MKHKWIVLGTDEDDKEVLTCAHCGALKFVGDVIPEECEPML